MLSTTATFFLLSLACPAAAAPPSAGPQAGPTPSLADQFAAIKKEHEQRERQFRDELRAADGDREKARRISKEQDAFTRRQADRIVALVRSHRDDPVAFDGVLVLVGTVRSFLPDDLVKLVLERHTAHPRMGELCFHLCYRTSEEWAERIIKAAVNHPVPETRGQVVYALADYCRGRAVRLAGEQQPMPEDAKRAFAQAERYYTDVAKNYADVRTPDGSARLGDKAAAELARLRNRMSLAVGRPAPEITGEDLDGKPMKLSDYRGKVVLLTFWGHWCGPCRSMYPHERSLVKRLEGQPFALLGVNSDTDRAFRCEFFLDLDKNGNLMRVATPLGYLRRAGEVSFPFSPPPSPCEQLVIIVMASGPAGSSACPSSLSAAHPPGAGEREKGSRA
jgi:hypothetical protein